MAATFRQGPRLRHLVMVNRPGWQSPEDFAEIGRRVMKQAADIGVFIANHDVHDPRLEEAAASRPSLVFSPCALKSFFPRRGAVAAGRAIDKPTQLARLEALGIPVPKWTVLAPETCLDPAEWGPYVMLKPSSSRSAKAKGLVIAPTHSVRYRPPEDYPEGHHGRSGPLIVQSFVVTGKAASHYRVLTLFGEALSCFRDERTVPLPDLAALEAPLQSDDIATNSHSPADRTFQLAADADVLALAKRCHAAFPEVPVKGVDIVRDAETGRLYALELNCTSNAWHISSNYFAEFRTGPLERKRLVTQFGAWDVAAGALIAATRALAR